MGRPNVNWNVGNATEKHSTYTSKVVKAGIPFASQVTEPNTKYIIKYDFDLGGESVEMPEESALELDGGNIGNGKVISNSTEIVGRVPSSPNALYGQYYHNNNPLGFNMNVTKECNTALFSAFMTPGAYVSYRFYPQDIAVFYHNGNKYHLISGNIENSSPERCFFMLLDNNYDYLGSIELDYEGHGQGLAVCDGSLYVSFVKSDSAQYPNKYGIAVFRIDSVILACTSEGGETHSDTYANKIQAEKFISLSHNCMAIDYDEFNEEFAVIDDYTVCHIYNKDFTESRSLELNMSQYISQAIKSTAVFQGVVLKKGVIYGTMWISDWGATTPRPSDKGSNIIYSYDTVKDKVVSFEKLGSPYQDPECEGLFKDPDDDNNLYFLNGINIDEGSTIVGILKASKINSLYGLDTKRENRGGTVNSYRTENVNVDNSYDFSNGPSNGSTYRPYKTLDSAIATAFGKGNDFAIYIRTATKNYVLPRLKIGDAPLFIQGVDCVPTVIGSIWAYGGTIRLSNLTLVSNNARAIYVSNNGFVFLGNVTISGTSGQIGLRLRDTASAKIETATITGFSTGVDAKYTSLFATNFEVDDCNTGVLISNTKSAFDGITIQDCTNGIDADACEFNTTTLNVSNCTNGFKARRTTINFTAASFNTVTTCFNVDESPIYGWIPRITLTSVTNVISKDSDFRGNVNFMCSAKDSTEFAQVLSFITNGAFAMSTIGVRVTTEDVFYRGLSIEKGEYVYNNPGFMFSGYSHTKILEAQGNFTYLPSIGTSSQRPVLPNTHLGYQYFDTTIGKPIFASAISGGTVTWVDATGTIV